VNLVSRTRQNNQPAQHPRPIDDDLFGFAEVKIGFFVFFFVRLFAHFIKYLCLVSV
jgi:hypothetical protein